MFCLGSQCPTQQFSSKIGGFVSQYIFQAIVRLALTWATDNIQSNFVLNRQSLLQLSPDIWANRFVYRESHRFKKCGTSAINTCFSPVSVRIVEVLILSYGSKQNELFHVEYSAI